MTNDDVIHRSRLRLFALAREMGSVRAACRLLGVHHSTYYRWRRQLVRFGPELLRPRERRQPRMPNAISPMVEQRILALALAYHGIYLLATVLPGAAVLALRGAGPGTAGVVAGGEPVESR